jgi:hypothetical protein
MNDNTRKLDDIARELTTFRNDDYWKPVVSKEPELRRGLEIAIEACNKRLETLRSDKDVLTKP